MIRKSGVINGFERRLHPVRPRVATILSLAAIRIRTKELTRFPAWLFVAVDVVKDAAAFDEQVAHDVGKRLQGYPRLFR